MTVLNLSVSHHDIPHISKLVVLYKIFFSSTIFCSAGFMITILISVFQSYTIISIEFNCLRLYSLFLSSSFFVNIIYSFLSFLLKLTYVRYFSTLIFDPPPSKVFFFSKPSSTAPSYDHMYIHTMLRLLIISN